MKSVWRESFKIKSYEVDSRNRLKMTQLFNFMQEAAGNHAYDLGCGYDDLIKMDYIWVLSKVKVRMDSYPGWGETITVETWPKGSFRLYAARDFRFFNENGDLLGAATSVWVLLDIKTMRPQRVESLKFNYHEHEDRHGLEEMLEKLAFAGERQETFDRTVSYNDIDVNNHVNNAKYIDWIIDCFPAGFLADRQVAAIQVNYLSQAKPDERITVKKAACTSKDDNDTNTTKDANTAKDAYMLESVNKESQNTVFQAKIEFR